MVCALPNVNPLFDEVVATEPKPGKEGLAVPTPNGGVGVAVLFIILPAPNAGVVPGALAVKPEPKTLLLDEIASAPKAVLPGEKEQILIDQLSLPKIFSVRIVNTMLSVTFSYRTLLTTKQI
mgnify:CR=1 FL=1